MQKNQILSTSPDNPSTWGAHALETPLAAVVEPALIFDACHVGVVLRTVMFVELVTAVVAMLSANTVLEWVFQLAMLTAGVFPATLLWLVTACSLKTVLQRWPVGMQCCVGVVLGALSGLCGCVLLNVPHWPTQIMPWLASAASGALLSALLVTALVLRAQSRAPADTTAQLAELQARIRPHFLFNTLNSAIALVRQEPARAETLLEDLADLFRHALKEPGHSVTLEQEIALAKQYLAIEHVRFGDRLHVQWELDPRANSARLPPLLLQPLVENAVQHGIEPSAEPGMVRISTQRRGQQVLLTITNTLPPATHPAAPSTRGNGIALANVRARLALLHDVRGGFHAGEHHGQYHVRIQLPCDADDEA